MVLDTVYLPVITTSTGRTTLVKTVTLGASMAVLLQMPALAGTAASKKTTNVTQPVKHAQAQRLMIV